jgi:membrane associated rhomboid family serine protease
MPGASHSIGEEIRGVVAFVGLIWVAFLVEFVVPTHLTKAFGLTPRTLHGLIGIVAMPFLHLGWGHLISNTIPLLVLLVLLAGSRAHTWEIVGAIVLLGGGLLWLLGSAGTTHAGASGLIFGLITFLIVSGILERRIIPMFISALVAFLYGGTLLSGILSAGPGISWQGHLYGAIAGTVVAYGLTREPTEGTDGGERAA